MHDAPLPMRRLVGGKWLRCGYTTGACAAAAAKAAATMLLTGRPAGTVSITTPTGAPLTLDVVDPAMGDTRASCAIRKDGGDDPDATDGALIYASVERITPENPADGETIVDDRIVIDGGEGIGRVTKPGLDQPVGAAAINSVPRRMIEEAVREAGSPGNRGGWRVVISCPTGEKIATKTFNPRLGVVGGISILGTTGIVEPMSNAALVETMAREISILAAGGVKDLLVVIGNYGETFARETLGLSMGEEGDGSSGGSAGTSPKLQSLRHSEQSPCALSSIASDPVFLNSDVGRLGQTNRPRGRGNGFGAVKSSNFIGDAIAQAAGNGFERVLVVGHLGKLVKVGIGMLNTHSSQGDGRIETLIACALEAGAGLEVLRELLGCVSTDAAVMVLCEADLLRATMGVLERRIQATFDRHTPDDVRLEWMCFTKVGSAFSLVAQSPAAGDLVARWCRS